MDEVKYLKFRSYLHIYCPFCHQSLNVPQKDTELGSQYKKGPYMKVWTFNINYQTLLIISILSFYLYLLYYISIHF